jgi:hypothetical protein
LNIAAAALKLGLWPEVLQNCYEALKVDPHNAKALYRRAQVVFSKNPSTFAPFVSFFFSTTAAYIQSYLGRFLRGC